MSLRAIGVCVRGLTLNSKKERQRILKLTDVYTGINLFAVVVYLHPLTIKLLIHQAAVKACSHKQKSDYGGQQLVGSCQI